MWSEANGSRLTRVAARRSTEEPGAVLVFAPGGRNADLIVELLRATGWDAHACTGPADLEERLKRHEEAGALVLTGSARTPEVDALIERFQADEPVWSSLPILLLIDDQARPRPLWRNLVQLPKPLSQQQLLDVLGIALDGRVRQRDLKAANQRLERLAYNDVLTGLPNRAALYEALERLQRGRREGDDGRFALLFLDVDRFKQVNDVHGHAAGDELLRAIAGTLSRAVREEDFVARLAGDEFIVVLTGAESAARARLVAERLAEPTLVRLDATGSDVVMSLSVGVLDDIDPGEDADRIIAVADARMYEDKVSKAR